MTVLGGSSDDKWSPWSSSLSSLVIILIPLLLLFLVAIVSCDNGKASAAEEGEASPVLMMTINSDDCSNDIVQQQIQQSQLERTSLQPGQ